MATGDPNATSVASSQYDNPFDDDSDWSRIVVAGEGSPGVIPPDGVKGFERVTDWDIKMGKGTIGATITLKTLPPAEGSFEFILWSRKEYIQWISFQKNLLYGKDYLAAVGSFAAVDIYHPALANIGIHQVVTTKVHPIRNVGAKLYSVTVEFLEWSKPPAQNVAGTVNASKNSSDNNPGNPDDPYNTEDQAQIREALIKAGANPGSIPGVQSVEAKRGRFR